MKRFVFFALCLLCSSLTFAQDVSSRILVGDMDNDGALSLNDVKKLRDVVVGKKRKKYIPAEYITVSLDPDAAPPAKEETKRHLLGDADGDGVVSVGDIAVIIDILNGNRSATYIMPDVVYDTLGVKNGHEYVDLGLSCKWSTYNADTQDEIYGKYFAWGETESKQDYRWATYKWMESGRGSWPYVNKYTFEDYQYSGIWYDDYEFVGDGIREMEIDDDAANARWGEDWHIPSFDEWYELKTECSWKWTTNYNGSGMSGYIVTSKVSGYTDKSIFLPVTGYMFGSDLRNSTTNGVYWSGSLETNASDTAAGLGFNSTSIYWFDLSRFYGLAIRPVRP